jgi:VWFA-related protein
MLTPAASLPVLRSSVGKPAIRTVLACWIAVFGSASAGQQLPPQLPPTFRAGIDAVQLDVSVLDRDRRPVRGLTAADFTVLEDGRPRQIVAFSAIELPPMPAALTPSGVDTVPPDVASNDGLQGRLVVILIDPFLERVMVTGRVTIADPPGITALRATASRIVDSLGPGDLAAVGHTIYGDSQNFTTDKTRLKRAIDSGAFGTNKRAEGVEWGNCNCGVCRLEAITRIADALRRDSQRRKTVFFIGERLRLAPVPGPCNAYLEPATKRMLNATQLANVTVHTVNPNALETTNVHAGDDFKPADTDNAVSEAAKNQERANRAQLIERQQSLQTVADWTGGRVITNTNAPESSVRSILEESSAYYLLAFQVPDGKPDGRFRPITVKVNRPDVQVRTRKGYYADAVARGPAVAVAPVSLEAIVGGLLPERGVSMTVTAAPFRGPAGTPVVVVATGVTRPAQPSGAAASSRAPQFEPIEILTSAFGDAEKEPPSQRQRLSVAMSDGGELKYESVSTLKLAPGSYEVRVATRQQRADLVGSVHTFVDVPDFNARQLTLSGVVLFDRRAPTATPIEAVGGVLDSSPTTRRNFTAADEVTAFARVYQKMGVQPVSATVDFRILDRNLREVTANRLTLTPEQFTKSGGADARFAIPMETLSPGSYVLRIEAAAAGQRDVRFTVK